MVNQTLQFKLMLFKKKNLHFSLWVNHVFWVRLLCSIFAPESSCCTQVDGGKKSQK